MLKGFRTLAKSRVPSATNEEEEKLEEAFEADGVIKFFRFDSLDRGVLFNLLSSSFCSLLSIALQPTTQAQWPEMPRRQSANPLPSPWFSSRETRLRNQQRPSKMTIKKDRIFIELCLSTTKFCVCKNLVYFYGCSNLASIKKKTQKRGTREGSNQFIHYTILILFTVWQQVRDLQEVD